VAAAARALAVLALAAACGAEPGTPEERVRAALAAFESAAEARDVGAAKEFVAEGYADAHGNDARSIRALVAGQLLRNQSIHLFSRVASLEVGGDGRARARLFVAMTGAPVEAPAELAGARGDLYRFDLELVEEDGDWRVVSADWAPAAPADFGLDFLGAPGGR
jgi:hypothetical protein